MSPSTMSMHHLPTTLDDLAGRRAARWVRESTAGQYDNWGPDAQRELQDRLIERYGLVDTGLLWQTAASGRVVHRHPAFAAMLDAARAGAFDLLLVGYVSRFQRNLKQTLIAVDDLHALGVAVLFADERILSSDADRWDDFVREAHEAESYSRKLGKRIKEGLAAKRRRLGEPGGQPPYGYTRAGKPPVLEPIPEALERVRACHVAAAEGLTDAEVAEQVGLPFYTARGILTNPLYAGRLRDGTPPACRPSSSRSCGTASSSPVLGIAAAIPAAQRRGARTRCRCSTARVVGAISSGSRTATGTTSLAPSGSPRGRPHVGPSNMPQTGVGRA
ncbi:MAG: recombinase family protein [Candidatus Limnocylindrales bacterium]